jgi:hypothetical protein
MVNNPLLKNIHNVSYINNNVVTTNVYDILIIEQLNSIKKYSEHVALNGYIFLLTSNDCTITPDFARRCPPVSGTQPQFTAPALTPPCLLFALTQHCLLSTPLRRPSA